MAVFYLEVHQEGELVLDEMHASEEGAKVSLSAFVHNYWDIDIIGRDPYTISAKEAIALFFDVTEFSSYSITPYKLQGEIPAEAPVPHPNPFPGMEPVPLQDVEVRIISACLAMVTPGIVRKYIQQYFEHDYPIEYVQKAQAAVIKKME
jgi:hypothetical protein